MKYRTKVMVAQTQTHDPERITEELLRVVREFEQYQAQQEADEKEDR
jgi:hypothetical protein